MSNNGYNPILICCTYFPNYIESNNIFDKSHNFNEYHVIIGEENYLYFFASMKMTWFYTCSYSRRGPSHVDHKINTKMI